MATSSRGLFDLQKEFRTMRLLGWALVILGAGLTLGGFGVGLMTRSATPAARVSRNAPAEAETGRVDNTVDHGDFAVRPPRSSANDTFMNYTSQLSFRTGILGVIFLIVGGVLIWILKNTLDDDKEVTISDELFKTYAAQLAVSEKRKEKERKRL